MYVSVLGLDVYLCRSWPDTGLAELDFERNLMSYVPTHNNIDTDPDCLDKDNTQSTSLVMPYGSKEIFHCQ